MVIDSLNFIPSNTSSDAVWIEYHKELKRELGKSNANILWTKTWDKRKNEGVLGSAANTSTLREYMKSQGVSLSADGIFSVAVNVWDSTTDLFESAFGISKYIVIILAVLVIIPAFMLAINIAKNPGSIIKASI